MAINYSWNNLPSVVIYDVFSYLNKKDLLNASATCENWRACLFHPKIWPIKSMTIDLVNISAYEVKNKSSKNSNSHFYSKKSNYHFAKPDFYYNNKFSYGNSTKAKRLINYHQKLNNRHESWLKKKTKENTSFLCYNNNNSNITNEQNQHQLLIKNNSNFYGQNDDLKADYRLFLEKCSKFLTSVTIKFNAYDYRNLIQLIYTINILTHARSKDLNKFDEKNENYFNNIESLILKPIYIKTIDKIYKTSNLINKTRSIRFSNQFNKRNENLNSDLLLNVFDAIEKLISTNRSIKHISLGCLEELLDHLPSLLTKLKNNTHVNELVESLNLATIKVDPFYYPVHDVKFTWFTSFKNLVKLSIDYDYVSDDFIIELASNCQKLKDLTLNIHGLDKEHPIVSSNAWNTFRQNPVSSNENFKVELTINLLHTNDCPEELKEIIQNVTIPITNFRAYFAFSTTINNPLKEIVSFLSTQQQSNLKQLTLVDKLEQNNGIFVPNITFSSMDENTLVMLAWRCRNLEELTLIGYELSEIDLLAITRLRGENLKQLLIPDCCVYLMNSKMLEDEGYYEDDKIFLDMASNSIRNQVINEISKPLNRNWTPLNLAQLSRGNNASQYYLNTILN